MFGVESGLYILRTPERPIGLDGDAPGSGPRVDQVEGDVRSGIREQSRALADDDGISRAAAANSTQRSYRLLLDAARVRGRVRVPTPHRSQRLHRNPGLPSAPSNRRDRASPASSYGPPRSRRGGDRHPSLHPSWFLRTRTWSFRSQAKAILPDWMAGVHERRELPASLERHPIMVHSVERSYWMLPALDRATGRRRAGAGFPGRPIGRRHCGRG